MMMLTTLAVTRSCRSKKLLQFAVELVGLEK